MPFLLDHESIDGLHCIGTIPLGRATLPLLIVASPDPTLDISQFISVVVLVSFADVLSGSDDAL